MESSTLPDPNVIAASGELVTVASHIDKDHGTFEVLENGKKVNRCKIYPNLACEDHERTSEVGKKYLKGRFPAPVNLWCDPTGKEIFRHYGFRRPEVFLGDLKAALEKVPGPRVSKADYDRQGPALLEAEQALQEYRYKAAIAGMLKASEGKVEAIRKTAEGHLASLRRMGDDMLQRARRHIDRGRTELARGLLKVLAGEFEGLECGRAGAELLKALGVESGGKEK